MHIQKSSCKMRCVYISMFIRMTKTEFRKLQREWYAKAKESGFDDIESATTRGDCQQLLKRFESSRRWSQARRNGIEFNFEFYRLAGWFLFDHEFESVQQQVIWSWVAEGIPYRTIASWLGVPYSRAEKIISRIINGPFSEYQKKQWE